MTMNRRAVPVSTALGAAFSVVAGLSPTGADAGVVSGTFSPGATSLTLPSGDAITFENSMAYAGSDYWGRVYYNRNLSASTSGTALLGSTLVGAGSAIDGASMAGAAGAMSLDSTTTSFYTTTVGFGGGCDKWGCWSYPYFGTAASQNVSDGATGASLLLPFDFRNGSTTDYGWLSFDVTDPGTSSPYQLTLDGFAYNDTGAAIMAGDAASPAPEPPSLVLLAAGALGLVAYRRRQRARMDA